MTGYPRKSSSARGYDSRWQKYRLSYLRKHPLCTRCKAAGLTVPSTVVDHIVKATEKPELFWEPSNHMALCGHCHSSDKQRYEKSGVRAYSGCAVDGTPLDPNHHWTQCEPGQRPAQRVAGASPTKSARARIVGTVVPNVGSPTR